MVTKIRRERLMIPVAPAIGAAFACIVSLFIALAPVAVLEQLVTQSGIAAVVAVAEPPLGTTARLVLILLIGGGLGALLWFATFLLFGPRVLAITPRGAVSESGAPAWRPLLRRGDAHPDAPARRPVFAQRDLGTPFLDIRAHKEAGDGPAPETAPAADDVTALLPEAAAAAATVRAVAGEPGPPVDAVQHATAALVERDLPVDLNARLAEYDPDAMRPAPGASFSPRLVRARQAADLAPGERLETFELTPMVRPEPSAPAPASPPASSSIAALLERLERGVTHKAERALVSQAADDSVQQSLASLSRVAARG